MKTFSCCCTATWTIRWNFHKFGRAVSLPMTGLWSLGGVLDAHGRAGATEEESHRRWMLSAEEGASEDARARQLDAASSAVQRALRVLRDRRGWDLSRVHLFGFSDGGAVALDVATRMTGRERLGSCAAVAAALPRPETYEHVRRGADARVVDSGHARRGHPARARAGNGGGAR